MKHIQMLCLAGAVSAIMSSCLEDKENYQAGFPLLKTKGTYLYANTVSDTLYVESYGSWQITNKENASWISLDPMKGYGYMSYSVGIKVEQNKTGEARVAPFKIEDAKHPGDAYINWNFYQMATRMDGTFGNAPLVKTITGSDGSSIKLTYDAQQRPLTLLIKKDDKQLANYTVTYDDYSQKVTVNNGSSNLTASLNSASVPLSFTGINDTVKIVEQDWYNMYHSNAYAFNVEQYRSDGSYAVFSHLIKKMETHPDSTHCADSLRYQAREGRYGTIEREYMGLTYSTMDNRCQSVDANQLVLGVEHCNPYLFMSLFRYTRSSMIISKATFEREADNITVGAELNADKSVKKLSVARNGQTITYDFSYTE